MEKINRNLLISYIDSLNLTDPKFNLRDPGKGPIEHAIDELYKEGYSYEDLYKKPTIITNRLLKINPYLSLDKAPKDKKKLNIPVVKIATLSVVAITFLTVYSYLSQNNSQTSKMESTKTRLKGAEFSSMRRCFERIPKSAGSSIDFIATDKPEKISGKLANGEHFSCEKKSSGTKGTYFEGWYTY